MRTQQDEGVGGVVRRAKGVVLLPQFGSLTGGAPLRDDPRLLSSIPIGIGASIEQPFCFSLAFG